MANDRSFPEVKHLVTAVRTARSSRPWHASCRRPGPRSPTGGRSLSAGSCTPTSTSNAACPYASTSPASTGAKTTNGRFYAKTLPRPTAVTSWTAATLNFRCSTPSRPSAAAMSAVCATTASASRGTAAVVGRSGRGRLARSTTVVRSGPGQQASGQPDHLLRLIFVPTRRTTNGPRRVADSAGPQQPRPAVRHQPARRSGRGDRLYQTAALDILLADLPPTS